MLQRADDAVAAAVSRATNPLLAVLRTACADGHVSTGELAAIDDALDAANVEVSSALMAIKPTVAYATWAAVHGARTGTVITVHGRTPTPEKVAEAVHRVHNELIKSRDALARRIARVAAEVVATLAGIDVAASRDFQTAAAVAVSVRAANGVLPVVLRLRRIAEGWSSLVDDVAAAAAAATGMASSVASQIFAAGAASRRVLSAAGEDAKELMTAATRDVDNIRAASFATEAEASAAGITAAGHAAAAWIDKVAAALTRATFSPPAAAATSPSPTDASTQYVPATKGDMISLHAASQGLEHAICDALDDMREDVRDACTITMLEHSANTSPPSSSDGPGASATRGDVETAANEAAVKMRTAESGARAVIEASLVRARTTTLEVCGAEPLRTLKWRAIPPPVCPGMIRVGLGLGIGVGVTPESGGMRNRGGVQSEQTGRDVDVATDVESAGAGAGAETAKSASSLASPVPGTGMATAFSSSKVILASPTPALHPTPALALALAPGPSPTPVIAAASGIRV